MRSLGFAYVANDPLNATDPTGRDACRECRWVENGLTRGGPDPVGDAIAGAVIDFTPILGTFKGMVEFVSDPSPMTAIGAIPGGKYLTAGKTAENVANAFDAAGDARRASKPDFIVTPDGAAMRPSAADNVTDMRNAGLPNRSATQTGEAGTVFTTPNNGNPMDIRVMEGGSGGLPRVVTSSAARKNDPLLPSGQQFPNGTSRQVRRDRSHVELDP